RSVGLAVHLDRRGGQFGLVGALVGAQLGVGLAVAVCVGADLAVALQQRAVGARGGALIALGRFFGLSRSVGGATAVADRAVLVAGLARRRGVGVVRHPVGVLPLVQLAAGGDQGCRQRECQHKGGGGRPGQAAGGGRALGGHAGLPG